MTTRQHYCPFCGASPVQPHSPNCGLYSESGKEPQPMSSFEHRGRTLIDVRGSRSITFPNGTHGDVPPGKRYGASPAPGMVVWFEGAGEAHDWAEKEANDEAEAERRNEPGGRD